MRGRRRVSYAVVAAAMLSAATFGFFAHINVLPTKPGLAPVLSGKVLVGRAIIIDGDTVEMDGELVRFNGIDAPESGQSCKDRNGDTYRCGSTSAAALDGFLAGSRPLRCEFVSRDRYDRFVGDCFRADGKSVAAWMVRQGHALDWPRYSQGGYADEQASAKAEKTGLWAGTFEAPWDWRANRRDKQLPKTNSSTSAIGLMASANCKIKGNISGKGDRIYHVPGQKFYAATRISSGQGELWFCSEAEARSAGWRRARS